MRTPNRRAIRDQLTTRNSEQLLYGAGPTVTGGPLKPIDLMEILNRSERGVSRGGAVSGAEFPLVSSAGSGSGRDPAIALSDGTTITFASVGDVGTILEESDRVTAG